MFSGRFLVRSGVGLIAVQRLPLAFIALSSTMTLLHARAEERRLRRFEVSFQVKVILLCIKILPNAFKNERKKKRQKKTLMPIDVDCRLVVDA